ncbi:MAG: hypothetical protein J0H00_10215 [Burkholderiales bacterium]|nr:hypothetical protein [Burkholderiales bacterium]
MQSDDTGIMPDHRAFVDSYTLSIRDFGDGEREVMVQRYDRRTPTCAEGALMAAAAARRGSAVAMRGSARLVDPGPWDEAFDLEAYCAWRDARIDFDRRRAEHRERAARRARVECAARLKAIKADRMLTLTYRECMTDRKRLARDWQEFVRRLRRYVVTGFQYVATHERQRRGAWHMHVAVSGRQNYRLVRAVWRSVVGADNGNIDVRNPWREKKLRHKLAAYMGKYIAKNAEEGELGERRVWCSKGIDQAPREVYGGVFTGWESAVELANGLLDPALPLVAWFSRRREILFLATSNRC